MTTKADHVRKATQTRRHTCHWPDCTAQVPPAMWGCRKHWYTLPSSLRAQVWTTYRAGQEDDLNPSAAYVAVARRVQRWIADYLAGQNAQPKQGQLL